VHRQASTAARHPAHAGRRINHLAPPVLADRADAASAAHERHGLPPAEALEA
jgi:hypothetical protein